MKQVDKEHYTFHSYCYPDRWASYYYQLQEIIACKPESVLEIGVGDAVVKQYLSTNTQISYTNVDIAEDLKPDIVGSIDRIPCPDNSFDVVCAFEVLEHIPFDSFEKAIQEMKRVAKKHVLISVPHFGPPVMFSLKIPFLSAITFSFKIPFPKKHVFNGQHYWELGKRGYSVGRIKKILSRHMSVMRDFVPFENQYHHFFILKK